jgi:membrane protein YqaA with SNARE-associated domain
MSRFIGWIEAAALGLGAPGILLVSFLDSSVLSLPEVADLLVIYMVTARPHRFALYVASATLGSLAGCLVLFAIGRKAGEAVMRRRFSSDRVERTLRAFRRHGVMAVLVPSILPPPAPFKIFVLLAGVAEISAARFAGAILIGRGARYLIEGLLALWFGEQALTYVREHGPMAALVVVAVLAAGFGLYLSWSRLRARAARA